MGRVTSIDKTGIKAQTAPELQREDTTRIEAANELMQAVGNSIALQDTEGRIKHDLSLRALQIDTE